MTEYELWMIWLTGGLVVANFLVVAVALLGGAVRRHFTKPKLTLSLQKPIRNDERSPTANKRGWFYTIMVRNQRRGHPAQRVQVLLTSVQKKAPDGSWAEHVYSGPVIVTWRWPELMSIYQTVGPEQPATIGKLLQHDMSFLLSVYNRPHNLPPAIGPNDPTRLTFQAVSDVVESAPLVVEIAWDGEWVDGETEMARHLVAKEVRG